MIVFRGYPGYHSYGRSHRTGQVGGIGIGKDDVMPSDDSQTTEPPIRSRIEAKSTVNDPRDDLREQVAAHRRDVQAFLARRVLSQKGQNTTRH